MLLCFFGAIEDTANLGNVQFAVHSHTKIYVTQEKKIPGGANLRFFLSHFQNKNRRVKRNPVVPVTRRQCQQANHGSEHKSRLPWAACHPPTRQLFVFLHFSFFKSLFALFLLVFFFFHRCICQPFDALWFIFP